MTSADSQPHVLAQMGIDESDVARRLRFVDFGDDDAARVRSLADVVLPRTHELTARFFDHLAPLPEASGLMSRPALIAKAKQLKARHLRAMMRGSYGLDYVEERLELGMLYAKGGLDPRVFLGAIHELLRVIGAAAMQRGGDAAQCFDDVMSLQKVFFFDLSLIVDVIVFERERVIRAQAQAIEQLSTPVLQVRDGVLILPLIGNIDGARAAHLTASLLRALRERRARSVVLDITGVSVVDSHVARHLLQAVAAARLMGARVVLTGVSAGVAESIVQQGGELADLPTAGDLQSGLELV